MRPPQPGSSAVYRWKMFRELLDNNKNDTFQQAVFSIEMLLFIKFWDSQVKVGLTIRYSLIFSIMLERKCILLTFSKEHSLCVYRIARTETAVYVESASAYDSDIWMDYPKLISEKWNLTAKFNCLQAIYFDAPSALAVPMCGLGLGA